MKSLLNIRWLKIVNVLLLLMVLSLVSPGVVNNKVHAQQSVDKPLKASPKKGAVPGGVSGINSDSQLWRQIRGGVQGTVSIPDQKAGVLVQSEGDLWRAVRNGPISKYGAWSIFGIFILLALFFTIRGRIRISAGLSSETITRFTSIERIGHWLLASSFIILAISGLNILYGRYILPDIIMSKEMFASMSAYLKIAHNYVAFSFMFGLALVFIMWVRHNFPSWRDIPWILQGGGLFSDKLHPHAKKFNAGQKLIFWLTILGGVSLSISGWSLLFPYTTSFFSDTFALLNSLFGLGLPENLTVVQEQQFASIWHGAMGLFLTIVIIAHIYIGSIGMQGAFSAVGSGKVDLNWAKEHHDLWVEEVLQKQGKSDGTPKPGPAE